MPYKVFRELSGTDAEKLVGHVLITWIQEELTRPGERIKDQGLLEIEDLTQLDIVAEIYQSDFPKINVEKSSH